MKVAFYKAFSGYNSWFVLPNGGGSDSIRLPLVIQKILGYRYENIYSTSDCYEAPLEILEQYHKLNWCTLWSS